MMLHQTLHVWKACDDVERTRHGGTRSFPRDERDGLTSQSSGTAVSAVANVAPGSRRRLPTCPVVHAITATSALRTAMASVLSVRAGLLTWKPHGVTVVADFPAVPANAAETMAGDARFRILDLPGLITSKRASSSRNVRRCSSTGAGAPACADGERGGRPAESQPPRQLPVTYLLVTRYAILACAGSRRAQSGPFCARPTPISPPKPGPDRLRGSSFGDLPCHL